MRLALAGLAVAALCAACPAPPPARCSDVEVWGDPAATPQVRIGMRGSGGTFEELTGDGDPVDLIFPLQGGFVLFVGARIQNMNVCRNELSSTLRDPATGIIHAFEKRIVDFPIPADDWGQPDLRDPANVANVPVCPDYTNRDVVDTDWKLEVKVRDLDGREAFASRLVRPACRQSDPGQRARCACECSANYYFGKCGGPDGGTLLDGGG